MHHSQKRLKKKCKLNCRLFMQDAMLPNQSAAHLRAALGAKSGALTAFCGRRIPDRAVRRIITYGSIASTLGSAGQASYAAANAVLEAMAAGLGAAGVPTLPLAWGAWGGVGMAAGNAALELKLRSSGVALMAPDSGLAALQAALHAAAAPLSSPSLTVAGLEWSRLLAPETGRDTLYIYSAVRGDAQEESLLLHSKSQGGSAVGGTGGGASAASHSPATTAVSAPPAAAPQPPPAAIDVGSIVRLTVFQILGREVGFDEPLVAAGLDSIGTVEVQTRLERATGVALPPTLVFDFPSITSIVAHLEQELRARQPVVVPAAAADVPAAPTVLLRPSPLPSPPGGAAALVLGAASGPLVHADSPKLTKSGYFTVPSIRRLQRMRSEELAAVPRFVIGRAGVGEVAFLYPVDLRGADLDKVVVIERGRISVYPPGGPRATPGAGLNQPALLTYKKIFPKAARPLRGQRAALKAALLQACVRMGATFVHYDDEEGVWMTKADVF